MAALETAFHEYVGVVVARVPVGEIVVGAAGMPTGAGVGVGVGDGVGEGVGAGVGVGVGVAPGAVMVRAPLHGLVPDTFAAFTNQLYVAADASGVAGVTEQVPVPAPQLAPAAVYMVLISTPEVFCTSSV